MNKLVSLESLSRYSGKTICHFEDGDGNTLDSVDMEQVVVLVFTDGDRLRIGSDGRGLDCYLCQEAEPL